MGTGPLSHESLRKGLGDEGIFQEKGAVVGGGAPLVVGLAGDGVKDLKRDGDRDADWATLGDCDALSNGLHGV